MSALMKDSGVEWIGMIPEHWVLSKFKKIANLKTGNSISDKSLHEIEGVDYIPYIATKDVSVINQSINYDNGIYISKLDLTFKKLFKDTSIICIEGGSAGRKLSFTDKTICFGNKLCAIKTKNNYNLDKFIFYFLQSKNFKYEFELKMNGLIGGVSIGNLINFDFIKPPLSEQKQIADYLDKKTGNIDKQIELLTKKSELLSEYKAALITETVIKGLDKDVVLKDSGVEWIGDIPEHWDVKSLKMIVRKKITDGPHETPICIDEGIPFISVNAIQNGELTFQKSKFISENDYKIYSKKANVEYNDILLGKAASIGKVARVKTNIKFSIWSPLALIKSKNNFINPIYLEFILKSNIIQNQIQVLSTLNTQQNISMKDIEKLKIITPPLSEQKQIADYLDEETQKIDKKIVLIDKKINLLKDYKQALIFEVVTGKMQVI